MSIFSLSKQRPFFTAEEQARIVDAIRMAEKETSGEIRIYVESHNSFVDPLDRAREIFIQLKMHETADRNAVLLYLAMKDHELALFGDEGIHARVGNEYWNNAVREMLARFADQHIVDGIEQCILQIGETLKEKFPYDAATDKNELPDDLVFGK